MAALVPDHDRVETVVYPRYETKGELAAASQAFLEWLKARVMDVRKAHLDAPWPPNDRQVGVVLVAHSMGGFVAADALCLALDERRAADEGSEEEAAEKATETTSDIDAQPSPLFPPIQGLLALDTPYNGLSRSMFVYGAFSNYSKVQTVFNVMTAVAAGPMALGRLALSRAAGPPSSASRPSSSSSSRSSSTAAWKMWQLVAVRTGTVGAIAAGGVAAYTHRKSIMAGVNRVRRGWKGGAAGDAGEASDAAATDSEEAEVETKKRPSLRESYQSGVNAIGQGLAYINRRNVGESFAWLSAHFTFVGALLKQTELNHRLRRLAGLRGGLGVHDLYVSLGENGYWSGGYFVPERTFCAVPEGRKAAAEKEGETDEQDGLNEAAMFERWTMQSCDDEVQAHISLFKRDKNTEYDAMTSRAAALVAGWFANEEPVVDTVGPLRAAAVASGEAGGDAAAQEAAAAAAAAAAKAKASEDAIRVTDHGVEIVDQGDEARVQDVEQSAANDGLPDESPIDIAATASLMETTEGAGGTAGVGTVSAETGSSVASAIVVDDDDDDDDDEGNAATTPIPAEDRATYLRHLLSVAQNAGTGLKRVSEWSSQLPAKMPRIDGLTMPSMPIMPNMPSMPTMPKSASTLLPGAHMFSRSKGAETEAADKTVSEGPIIVESGTQTAGPAAVMADTAATGTTVEKADKAREEMSG